MKYCFIWKDSGAIVSCYAIFDSIEEATKAKRTAKNSHLFAVAGCYVGYEIVFNHKSAPSIRHYRQYISREIALRAIWAMEADPKTYGNPILTEYVRGVID